MKVRLRKCKFCGVTFKPTYSTVQTVCSPRCSIEYSKMAQKAKDNREWQREKKKRKEALLSRKDWLDLAQKVVNAFVRERDKGKPCHMCQKPISGVVHACHYLSAGNHSFVRFHEDNIWSGCYSCNVALSGNLIEYRKVLLKIIGEERLNWLEENGRREKKWEIDEIKEIIKIYKGKTKELSEKNKNHG